MDQAACSNDDFVYPTAKGAEDGLIQAKKANQVNTLQFFQAEAAFNDIVVYPMAVVNNVKVYNSVSSPMIRTVTPPLNHIQSLQPAGSFQAVSKYPNLARIGTWGLPVLNGIIYGVDIEQDYDIGLVTRNQRLGQHGANAAFVVGTGASGAGIASLTTASTPVSVPVATSVFLAFDLTVAQEFTNNLIEGQGVGKSFWNARESAIEIFALGIATPEEIDSAINSWPIWNH